MKAEKKGKHLPQEIGTNVMQDKSKTTTRAAMACHILDHGWGLSEHRQDGNHQYTTWQRPFLTGVDLESAYAMQRAQEDEMGEKCPLEEAKKLVAGWKS